MLLQVTHFWQFATHWSNGDQAKMNMSCEDGKLHFEFHADIDHPDQQQLSNNTTKKKSPSKIRSHKKIHPVSRKMNK